MKRTVYTDTAKTQKVIADYDGHRILFYDPETGMDCAQYTEAQCKEDSDSEVNLEEIWNGIEDGEIIDLDDYYSC